MKPLDELYDEALPADIRDRLLTDVVPVRPDARMTESLKSRILSRLEKAGGAGTRTVHSDQGAWRAIMPKVQIKMLHREGNCLSYLLRLEPGAVVPPHEHPEDEECMVLQGEVEFGDIVGRPGDYHIAHRGALHDCIRSPKGGVMFVRGAIGELAHLL